MSKLSEVLKKLGIDEETTTLLTGPEEDQKDLKPAEIVKAVHSKVENKLKNDDAFMSPIKNEIRGKVLGSKQNKFMKLFDISQDEFDALPDTTKFDDMVSLGLKKFTDKIKTLEEGKGGEADKKEITRLKGELEQKKEIITGLKEDVITKGKEVQSVKDGFQFRGAVEKNLSEHELTVKQGLAFKGLNDHLQEQFDPRLVDGKIVLYQKGKAEEGLRATTEAGDDLSIKAATKAYLEAEELIATSKGGGTGKGTKVKVKPTGEEDEPKFQLPGLKKANAHAEGLK